MFWVAVMRSALAAASSLRSFRQTGSLAACDTGPGWCCRPIQQMSCPSLLGISMMLRMQDLAASSLSSYIIDTYPIHLGWIITAGCRQMVVVLYAMVESGYIWGPIGKLLAGYMRMQATAHTCGVVCMHALGFNKAAGPCWRCTVDCCRIVAAFQSRSKLIRTSLAKAMSCLTS